jgi:hypothetical protein
MNLHVRLGKFDVGVRMCEWDRICEIDPPEVPCNFSELRRIYL